MAFLDVLKSIASPVTSAVSGVASLGTSLINAHSQKETNKRNAEQNDLSREFTAQQAQLDRDFNAQQSDKQNAFNADEAAKSRVFNADQARQQMEFQEKMWNAQNEYNDPSAQIARLKAAGINPNWSDGFDNTAGSVSGGTAATSSPASGSPASHGSVGAPSNIPMQPVTLENPLMMAAQTRLANAQADKAASESDYTKAQKNRLQELLSGEKEQQRIQILSDKFDLEQLKPAQVDNLLASTQVLDKDLEVMDENIRKIIAEIDKLKAERNYTDEQIRHIKIDNEYLPDMLVSEIRKNLAQAGMNDAQASLYAQEASNAILDGYMLMLDYDTANKTHMTDLKIKKSEQQYSLWRANKINKHKEVIFTLDQGKEVVGGVSRGAGAVATRIIMKGLR